MSPIDFLYLNCGIGGECGGYIGFSTVMAFNPAQTDIEKERILGGEAFFIYFLFNKKKVTIYYFKIKMITKDACGENGVMKNL